MHPEEIFLGLIGCNRCGCMNKKERLVPRRPLGLKPIELKVKPLCVSFISTYFGKLLAKYVMLRYCSRVVIDNILSIIKQINYSSYNTECT